MSGKASRNFWWAALVLLAAGSAVWCWQWREQRSLLTSSEISHLERVEGSFHKGKAPQEKNELNPVVRKVLAMAGEGRLAAQEGTDLVNAASLALLVLLFVLLMSLWVPKWVALVAGLAWVVSPQVVGQSLMGTAGLASALFLLGPAMGLGLCLNVKGRLWKYAGVAIVGVGAGMGILAHPLGIWVGLSLLGTLFMTRSVISKEPGLVSLPAVGSEWLVLLGALLAGFAGAKMLIGMKGADLLAFLFGYLEGPHPPFAFLGEAYRGGQLGGPPWYTVWVLLLIRLPAPLLLAGLAGLVFLGVQIRKGSSGLRDGWPFWGAGLVLLLSATLLGSPVVPAGLNLLVPLTLVWVAMAAWGGWQFWNWLHKDTGVWRLTGQVAMVVLAVAGPASGLLASFTHATLPQAYANYLGLGTQTFLAYGNDPVGEMAIPAEVRRLLAEDKPKEFVVFPGPKTAQRLLSADETTQKLKVREGGALPVLLGISASSPAAEMAQGLFQDKTPSWGVYVQDWPLWVLYK